MRIAAISECMATCQRWSGRHAAPRRRQRQPGAMFYDASGAAGQRDLPGYRWWRRTAV